jgi:hypothetical protein
MTYVLHVKDAEYGWMAYQQSDDIEVFSDKHKNNFWELLRHPDVTGDDYSGKRWKHVGKYMYEVFE